MFPTAHEKYGLADQVGWQNVMDFSAGTKATFVKHLVSKVIFHDWYLAQSRDGVYAAGGALLFRDLTVQSGRHIGEEIDLITQYNWVPHYVGGGFGHLIPGQFLDQQSPGSSLNYLYLNVGYRF